MRRPIIAGNWKMNKTIDEAVAFVRGLIERVASVNNADVVVAPPSVALRAVADRIARSNIQLAAQNMHWETSGAYTGEVSGPMLRTAGCEYVIIGHSERREFFGETDETVNLKIKAALSHSLTPIVCFGETLEEREASRTEERVMDQLQRGLEGLTDGDMRDMVLAYEPIWAIGTGRTASPQMAQDVHGFVRQYLAKRFSAAISESTRIQYGGSVNPKNVAELMSQPDIDGALVGGASLTVESFGDLVVRGAKA